MPSHPTNSLQHLLRITLFWLVVCIAVYHPETGTSIWRWLLIVVGSLFGIIGIGYCSHRLQLLTATSTDTARPMAAKLRQTALLATEYSLCLVLTSALTYQG